MWLLKDQSRMWGTCYSELTAHHIQRYIFAREKLVGKTLDAACGIGYGAAIMANVSPGVVGVDIEEDAIEWARKYFPGPRYICGDISKAPWEGKFDTVVSFETIEHIPNPKEVLRKFRGSCYTKLIVSVPNEEVCPFAASDFAGDKYPHYRHYTPQEFEDLLTWAGFKVKERHCQKSKTEANVVEGTDGRYLIYVCA